MYQFPKVQYLQDNSVMPITLYLKYDPLVVLSENTDKPLTNKDDNDDEKKSGGDDEQKTDTNKGNDNKLKQEEKKEESCNYWKQLQDDIYRWAVEEKYELWQVLETCNVYTMPAIQSPIIEQNIITYYHDKQNKKIVQQKLVNAQDESELRTMSSFVVEDEYYKSYVCT